MSLFYLGNDSSDDRWSSQSHTKPHSSKPPTATSYRPRTPGRIRSKSQTEISTPFKQQPSQIAQEQEAYASEFQVDPQAMQMLLDSSTNQQNSSRYTLAANSVQAKEPMVEDNKRASIYYGALRVPIKAQGAATAQTPGRKPATEQPTPGGLLNSARRVPVKGSQGPIFASQTPSRQSHAGVGATPGRMAALMSGASRMNALATQQQSVQYATPGRAQVQQTQVGQSPSTHKKPVVVEETYIRRLTYDDAESMEEHQLGEQQYEEQYYEGEPEEGENGERYESPTSRVSQVEKPVAQVKPPQNYVPTQQHMPRGSDAMQQESSRAPSSVVTQETRIPRQASAPVLYASVAQSAAPEMVAVKSEPKAVPANAVATPSTSVSEEMSRDVIEKRLIANQRRRREIMEELSRLDVEQMDLIKKLQTLPK